MSLDDWDKMTGAELAHILALPDHAAALQQALDATHAPDTDWDKAARDLLATLSADPAFVLTDASTDKPVSALRVDVLAEELRRAALEEG